MNQNRVTMAPTNQRDSTSIHSDMCEAVYEKNSNENDIQNTEPDEFEIHEKTFTSLNNNNLVLRNKTEKRISDDIDVRSINSVKKFDIETYEKIDFRAQIKWPDLIVQLSLHTGSLYGIYLMFTSANMSTTIIAFLTIYTSGLGITAGVHRLWSHRAYRAKLPLRVLLATLFTITGQRDIYSWAMDHRVHHKYGGTVADPHDIRRGFWFAHVGWLVLTPHPAVEDRRKDANANLCDDLKADPVVLWHKRLYIPLFVLLNIVIPVSIPVWWSGESLWNSFFVCFVARFTATLNIAYSVNSFAHMMGDRPYDKGISAVETAAVSLAALGEGWHNYHHVFPWDYKTGEFGNYALNWSTGFIDFFARIGWAYDRKAASPEMIARRSARCGDGTRILSHHHDDNPLWGFGDKDISPQDANDLSKMTT